MAQTAQQMMAAVGRVGLLMIDSLRVPVEVLDSRYTFGRTDLLVSPVGGNGQQWVERARVDVGGAQ